jgi:hypothetical protein
VALDRRRHHRPLPPGEADIIIVIIESPRPPELHRRPKIRDQYSAKTERATSATSRCTAQAAQAGRLPDAAANNAGRPAGARASRARVTTASVINGASRRFSASGRRLPRESRRSPQMPVSQDRRRNCLISH